MAKTHKSLTSSAARFWSTVNKTGHCWIWTGRMLSRRGTNLQYGKFLHDGKEWLAHRFSFALANNGQKPPAVLHECDVPLCVRPSHLKAGTQAQNIADMLVKGRARLIGRKRRTHCNRGHEFTPSNSMPINCNGKPGRRCRTCYDMAKAA